MKYRPLYRARTFDQLKRKVSKMVEGRTWFRGVEIYDMFRNDWKSNITFKQQRCRRKYFKKMFQKKSLLNEMKIVMEKKTKLLFDISFRRSKFTSCLLLSRGKMEPLRRCMSCWLLITLALVVSWCHLPFNISSASGIRYTFMLFKPKVRN